MKTLDYPWSKFSLRLKVPEKVFLFLEKAKSLAKRSGFFLYLAGGPVRDVLLGREVKDLDLVLQGNWEELLANLLKETEAMVKFRSQFLTYKILFADGFTLDLVTARKEVYKEPASLPEVSPGTYLDDIMRRDFTINSLIYGLTPPQEERIVDLLSGTEDLQKGLLRPLHIKSFVEDPTRAFRGVRYKVRFSFRYSEDFFLALTEGDKFSSFKKLSPSRLSQELKLFVTKEPLANISLLCRELQEVKLLKRVDLQVKEIAEEDFILMKRAKEELKASDFERFFLLFLVKIEEKTLRRLNFPEEEINKMLEYYRKFQEGSFLQDLPLLEKVEFLERIPPYFLFRLALEKKGREIVMAFWDKWRHLKPALKGKDLLAMGVKEGKKIGEILREIRRAKLEGKIHSLEEEKILAKNLIFLED
uniref:CCA tRNA nucleotidyltransferase n=1 Tax=Caldimicrobium thiodismutans TaxID=1653476 RepID=A0A832LWL8_9BACT